MCLIFAGGGHSTPIWVPGLQTLTKSKRVKGRKWGKVEEGEDSKQVTKEESW